MGPKAEKLLAAVRIRQCIGRAGRSFYRWFLFLSAVYAGLLLAARLLGLLPEWFAPATLITLCAAALALAVASYRRPAAKDSARAVDGSAQTEDLFLTAALIESAAGDYKPLVAREAERRAPEVRPSRVTPFLWQRPAGHMACVLGALLVAGLFLPQLDPFGRHEARKQADDAARQLQESRRATALRVAALERDSDRAELSREVDKALNDLKQTFDAARPKQQQANLQKLTNSQKNLSALWRKASESKLKDARAARTGAQRFGLGADQRVAEWQQDLREGRTDSLRRDLANLKEALKRMAETDDPAERQRLAEEIKKTLEQMSDCNSTGACSSPSLDAALQRALEQLAMAGMEGLNSDALQGLGESLDLANMELEDLERLLQDSQSLEEALKALQLAKQLNQLDKLDGELCDKCQGMADYAALFAQLEGQYGERWGEGEGFGQGPGQGGAGPGMGGPGRGRGGIAPEDPTQATDFTPERARSAVQAGKIILSLKVQGLSDPGEAELKYKEYVEQVKQGVSEAILHEEVPPAYHDAIQGYFDSMGGADEDSGQP